MIQTPISARACLYAFFAAARSAACLSRILLLIVAVETLTMPFTQGLWSWDRFMHGGQDFELGLLIILTCLCLVLLRVQQRESCLRPAFIIRALFKSAQKPIVDPLLTCMRAAGHRSQIPSPPGLAVTKIPLLI